MIGFLHFTNAPTESSQKVLPMDADSPTLEHWLKTVVFFHEEHTFFANECQNVNVWCKKKNDQPKSEGAGAGITVSDFVNKFH